MNDDNIIALFQTRSEDAIDALDERYGRACRSVSYRILNDRSDAEECVSDAYLAVWNAIPPAEPKPLFAFVCKIVRNLSLKRYAKNTAAKRGGVYDVALEELEECLPSPDGVEDALAADELRQTIETFLSGLSAENRVIFMRRYWFSDPYEEIAGKVGLTTKNVSVRLTRIRRNLRQYLTERGF